GIFGVAGALMSAAVAMEAISSLKGVTDIIATGKTVPGGPQKGGGPKSSPLSVGKKAGLLAATSALFLGPQDVYSLTGGIGLNPALFQPINSLSLDSFSRSEEHTSELQSRENLVCRLLLEKKK